MDAWTDAHKIAQLDAWRRAWEDRGARDAPADATVAPTPAERATWEPLRDRGAAPPRRVLAATLDLALPEPPTAAAWAVARGPDGGLAEGALGRPACRVANDAARPVYEFYTAEFVYALAAYLSRRLARRGGGPGGVILRV